MIKKILLASSLIIISQNAFAQSEGEYPNLSGKILFESRNDRVTSTNKANVDDNNIDMNIDADFNLKLHKNWSIITDWSVRNIVRRNPSAPERYREILSNERGFALGDTGLIIEQIKGQFENEDMRFFFGKFNPAFGTAFRKEKRIGVFTTDFTKDYELREKIGGGVSALLENSELTFNAFFNDTTGLSDSAFNRRGEEKRSDGIAGNTKTPSSFSIAIEGADLFGISDLFYNAGYRRLEVDEKGLTGRDDETGFVGGLEYLFPIGINTSIIPFVEYASIKNFSGIANRDADYTTLALIGKYSGWSASVSNVRRNIKGPSGKFHDYQLQYSIGYKFTNNIAIDVSKANIKENGNRASLIGLLVSYMYVF